MQKAATHVTVTCPSAAAIGAPSPFSGALSGAPADALVAVLHISPSGPASTDAVITGAACVFTDMFAANQPGTWQAEAHYNGDANHASATAICQFTVPRRATTLSLQSTPTPTSDSSPARAGDLRTRRTRPDSNQAQLSAAVRVSHGPHGDHSPERHLHRRAKRPRRGCSLPECGRSKPSTRVTAPTPPPHTRQA